MNVNWQNKFMDNVFLHKLLILILILIFKMGGLLTALKITYIE